MYVDDSSLIIVGVIALVVIGFLIYCLVLLDRSERLCSAQAKEISTLKTDKSRLEEKVRQYKEKVEEWKLYHGRTVRMFGDQINSKSAKLAALQSRYDELSYRFSRLSIRFRRIAGSSMPIGPVAGIFESYARAIAEQAEVPRQDH